VCFPWFIRPLNAVQSVGNVSISTLFLNLNCSEERPSLAICVACAFVHQRSALFWSLDRIPSGHADACEKGPHFPGDCLPFPHRPACLLASSEWAVNLIPCLSFCLFCSVMRFLQVRFAGKAYDTYSQGRTWASDTNAMWAGEPVTQMPCG